MSTGGQSLRWLIDKWFGLASESTYRLTRSPRAQSSCGRCICLEATGTRGALRIFFFRLDDGSWSVNPPAPKKPTFFLD
jgi:hypothetical protein